jgi:hypothetical protein
MSISLHEWLLMVSQYGFMMVEHLAKNVIMTCHWINLNLALWMFVMTNMQSWPYMPRNTVPFQPDVQSCVTKALKFKVWARILPPIAHRRRKFLKIQKFVNIRSKWYSMPQKDLFMPCVSNGPQQVTWITLTIERTGYFVHRLYWRIFSRQVCLPTDSGKVWWFGKSVEIRGSVAINNVFRVLGTWKCRRIDCNRALLLMQMIYRRCAAKKWSPSWSELLGRTKGEQLRCRAFQFGLGMFWPKVRTSGDYGKDMNCLQPVSVRVR